MIDPNGAIAAYGCGPWAAIKDGEVVGVHKDPPHGNVALVFTQAVSCVEQQRLAMAETREIR